MRESVALIGLRRIDEADAAARAGLADLPTNDPSLRADRLAANLYLGLIAESDLDYAGATSYFKNAEGLAESPTDKLSAQLGLIEAATFTDPDAALAAAGRADALASDNKQTDRTRALLRRYESELMLNRGDLAAAKARAAEAVKLMGGLKLRTTPDDVSARSDYAIAAMLSGDKQSAREYLAYTGAGRLPKGNFDPGAKMAPPDCGGEAGLRPNDVAVVEFSVADDGSVVDNRPVYAAGGGQVALAFARAAGDWSWTPEQAKAFPTFYRTRVRVEMRCSTTFERPSVGKYLDGRLAAWLADKDVAPAPDRVGSDAAALPAERAELAAREARAGVDSLTLVPVLKRVAENRVVSRDEANMLARRALAILDRNGAAGTPRLAIEILVWRMAAADTRKFMRDEAPGRIAAGYGSDPEARAAARLLAADALARWPDRVRAALQPVADDPQLGPDSPIRAAALVRLASIERQSGNERAAREAFERSHLAADQCAMIDSPPHLLHAGGTFPLEAMQWGFEGWTQVQFDIDADGKPSNGRAVVAYPPFVFSQAGTQTMLCARFARTYRPDGGLGCGGQDQRVKFLLPGRQ